jgi:hypothetical protein
MLCPGIHWFKLYLNIFPFCAAHQLHCLKPSPVLNLYVEVGCPEVF